MNASGALAGGGIGKWARAGGCKERRIVSCLMIAQLLANSYITGIKTKLVLDALVIAQLIWAKLSEPCRLYSTKPPDA